MAPSSPAAVVQERASLAEAAMRRLPYAYIEALRFLGACFGVGATLGIIVVVRRG